MQNGPILVTPAPIFHIAARRWFERTNGNTYHSIVIYQDAAIVAEAPLSYGYGEQWLETAAQLLDQLGTLPARKYHDNGSGEALHRWAERAGFSYSTDCVDVPRKKDL